MENIIAIPFRNRQKHLDYFIENTVPLIREHLPNTKIVVIEQNEGKLFNRGALLNIAFKEYEDKTKYFFTHDVDLNPTVKCIKEHFTKEVSEKEVLGIFTHHHSLGGIIKIRNSVFQKVNGFPNDIWGWGSEDKALQNRTEFFNIKKIQNLAPEKKNPEYLLRFDDINDREKHNHEANRKKHNEFKKLTKEKKLEQIMESGLNNLKYKILERKDINEVVEIIKIDL